MTKKDEEAKVTGKDLLNIAIEEMKAKNETQLKTFLKNTVTEKRNRELWISNRNKQIKKLEKLQVQIVKAYDAGALDDDLMKRFNEKLAEIRNDKASAPAVSPYIDEDDEEEWDL